MFLKRGLLYYGGRGEVYISFVPLIDYWVFLSGWDRYDFFSVYIMYCSWLVP